ncbi:M15 family metallopeptidase [Leucobacter sp. CSA2]|uniref:M15 family metallopeptidase n=2 Tax=Leucobacter edaphi TaxID=2796472 RepID=A0A934UX74_9MICO|nr:M15 family metallopeptidase [Leucobacter edaphi]
MIPARTSVPRAASRAGKALAAATLVGLALGLSGCAPEPEPEPKPTPAETTTPTAPAPTTAKPTPKPTTPPAPPAFDKQARSIDDPASIWVVTDKLRPLAPKEYEPADLRMPQGFVNTNGQPLRDEAATAVEGFLGAAAQNGLNVQIISAYRPYGMQVELYNSYIARDGQAAADTYSARPGFSEHQTGLVVDLDDGSGCALSECFGGTAAGKWLAEHAAEHGFIIRYPQGKQEVTGFIPEPWHFRYVGKELAAEMKRTGVVTLEEFFGLPAAPGYAD